MVCIRQMEAIMAKKMQSALDTLARYIERYGEYIKNLEVSSNVFTR